MKASLKPTESTLKNNPNHPVVKCVDGMGEDGAWTADDDPRQRTQGPYQVFDVLNQQHIGPRLPFRWMAKVYLMVLGGSRVRT